MAKRFTDTEKWKKPFIRTLPAPYKLLWFYILDDCNHAGIWEVDIEVASIRIGEEVQAEKALHIFGDRVQKISENKWFLPDFIFFQYGELNEKNRLHLSVIQILNKYNIKPLISPLEGAKEKDKEKDKEKEKGGMGEKTPEPEFIPPPETLIGSLRNDFKAVFSHYFFDEGDNATLLEIAKKLAKERGMSGNVTDPSNSEKIRLRWGELVNHIRADAHLSKYSLSQINKHFSSIIQSISNEHTGKTGKIGKDFRTPFQPTGTGGY